MDQSDFLKILQSRRTIRAFENRSVPREILERVLEAATSAPSPTNRQPWRFTVVTSAILRTRIVEAVRSKIAEVKDGVARAGQTDHLAGYWDFFVKPLESAPVLIVPQYRVFPDTIANIIKDSGCDPRSFSTCDGWQAEHSAVSAATMQLCLQAHVEGLGSCWMSGMLLARSSVEEMLGVRAPWNLLGGIALGFPASVPEPTPRKPLSKVVDWL